ncbi:hypothetical protein HY612_05060 [Candidatus Roizmanbacteria bacterium]|nr:hypothetical protein [Candidatus Roizmanbacteria bacterium]
MNNPKQIRKGKIGDVPYSDIQGDEDEAERDNSIGTNEGGFYDENNIVDADSDNPPAGTPGHPGIDDDTG